MGYLSTLKLGVLAIAIEAVVAANEYNATAPAATTGYVEESWKKPVELVGFGLGGVALGFAIKAEINNRFISRQLAKLGDEIKALREPQGTPETDLEAQNGNDIASPQAQQHFARATAMAEPQNQQHEGRELEEMPATGDDDENGGDQGGETMPMERLTGN